MKFIRLEIHNLASLDRPEGEVICFDQGALGNSNIFSIVGPTGSGKSTLLDAICLALYGRAPRYIKDGKNNAAKIKVYGPADEGENNRLAPTDPRNILTRGKRKGYSKLTFLANNGTIYRAEWHVSKGTKNFDKAKVYLYRIIDNQGSLTEQQADWAELPQIIGLGYRQFLQTVLIAQGSFANFLSADEDSRYGLLEQLIGSGELYANIASSISERYDDASRQLAEANAKVDGQQKAILPAEELAALQARIKELEEAERQAQAELTRVTEAIGWYTLDDRFAQNLKQYQLDFCSAQQQLQDFAPQAQRLALHDATLPAVAHYKDICQHQEQQARLGKQLQDLAAQIDKHEQTLQHEVNVVLKELQQSALQANRQLDEQRPHINQARAIRAELQEVQKAAAEKTRALSQAQQDNDKAQEALTLNQQAIQRAQTQYDEATRQQTLAQQTIAQQREQDQQRVQQASAQYAEQKQRLDLCNADQLQQAQTQAEQQQLQLRNAIRIQKDLVDRQQQAEKTQAEQQQLTTRNQKILELLPSYTIEQLQREVDTLTRTYTLMTSQDWQLHRSELTEGQACPLCGSTHHPYCQEEQLAPVQHELEALIRQKQQTLQQQTQDRQKLLDELNQNQGKLQTIAEALTQLARQTTDLTAEWDSLHALYPLWPSDAEQMHALQPQADAQARQAAQALKDYNLLVRQTDRLLRDKEAAEQGQRHHEQQALQQQQQAEQKVHAAHTLLQTELGKTANLQSQLSDRQQALQAAKLSLVEATDLVQAKEQAHRTEVGDQDPDVLERKLTQAKEQAEQAVKDRDEKIAQLRERLKELQGSERTTRQQCDEASAKLLASTEQLDLWLADYNATPEHTPALTRLDIAQLYAATDAWADIRALQQRLTQAFTSAQTTFDNETRAHHEHQQHKPEQSRDELLTRKQELEALKHDELIELHSRLQQHNDALQQAGILYQEQQQAQQLANEWKAIYDAIGYSEGKTLRKIAQCYTLRFLIAHANVEIRKFNRRYELMQVRNSLGIRVIDHDRGDDIRDTSSLSGGETFIVSLGLALGLSSLSSRNISFQNLFIDEGFGTLDPDTLATVIDSLAMLQSSQGKKVGVISHTDTMSERITTQIRIIKNGNSGSSHIEVYP